LDNFRQNERRHGGDETNIQHAAAGIRFLIHRVFDVLQFGEDGCGAGEQAAPGIGQHHAAGQAVEERLAQFLLQFLNLLAEGRLGNVAAFGGAAETSRFGNRHEISQLVNFHVVSFIFGVGADRDPPRRAKNINSFCL